MGVGESSTGRVVCGHGQRVQRGWRECEGRGRRVGRERERQRGFLRRNVIIMHYLLELVDDHGFHRCFSVIITVFVAVAT